MDDTSKIPISSQPASWLEKGPNAGNLAASATERHPVDTIQRQHNAPGSTNPYRQLDFVRSVYGSVAAMELAAETQIAQKEQVMGMKHVSSIYKDIATGQDTTIGFEHVLGLEEHRPDLPKTVLHPFMARQL